MGSESAFFIYGFRVQQARWEEFERWARERGINFWKQQPGIISYQTFRSLPGSPLQKLLGGRRVEADVISVVEAASVQWLRHIMQQAEFRRIQRETLHFIVPGSAWHQIASCAYRWSHEKVAY